MSPTIRNVLIGVAVMISVILFVVGLALAWLVSSLPSGQGERVAVTEGVVGVETGGSYAWVVRTDNGALLVDAGMDGEAGAILAELTSMGLGIDDVHTILLTHAHRDHTGGLVRFPNARLIHGPGEGPLLRGEDAPLGMAPSLMLDLMAPPVLPANIVEAQDGEVLDIDGVQVTVHSTPGHTLGSTSFQLGEVLFVGDAAFNMGEGAIGASPSMLNSDNELAVQSVRGLGPLDAVWMADGHAGVTSNADSAIEAWIAANPR